MTIAPGKIITPHQLELLALVANGYQFSEIAAMKFLSPYTIRNNLLTARDRIGAKNLVHLCVICVDAGLITKNGGNDFKPNFNDERIPA